MQAKSSAPALPARGMDRPSRRSVLAGIAAGMAVPALGSMLPALAQMPSRAVILKGARIFDGRSSRLVEGSDVLVQGNRIAALPRAGESVGDAEIVDCTGRTLMPGLIDVHVHLTFSALSQAQLMSPDLTPQLAEDAAAREAERMLLRGFTAVRDLGGPIFSLKRRIDSGGSLGPRVWPSGAVISQTSGHGDFRSPAEPSRRFTGKLSRSEQLGANFIADGRDEVLTAVRENLRQGASQIKLMAGGGTSSAYDPIDVTQYTLDEMRAAVEAAEDWNTYVAVHAYTPRAVRRAIEAGVRCVEHGQLLDEATLGLMAEKGVWLSGQNLARDTPNMDPERREKRRPIVANNPRIWPLVKKLGVKLALGTDFLFEPALNAEQNAYLLQLTSWFSPAEILKIVTHDNAQLLALSGPRSPYAGKLGVIEAGALADLLVMDGDPLQDIALLSNPDRAIRLIMKDGAIVKNGMQGQP